jgi:hypothetical protein
MAFREKVGWKEDVKGAGLKEQKATIARRAFIGIIMSLIDMKVLVLDIQLLPCR